MYYMCTAPRLGSAPCHAVVVALPQGWSLERRRVGEAARRGQRQSGADDLARIRGHLRAHRQPADHHDARHQARRRALGNSRGDLSQKLVSAPRSLARSGTETERASLHSMNVCLTKGGSTWWSSDPVLATSNTVAASPFHSLDGASRRKRHSYYCGYCVACCIRTERPGSRVLSVR